MDSSVAVTVVGSLGSILMGLAAVVTARKTRNELSGPPGDGRPLGERVAALEAVSVQQVDRLVRVEDLLLRKPR